MSLFHITKTESDNDPPVPPHRFTFDGRAITFIYCEPWILFAYHDCGELYLFITCIEMQPLIKEVQNWWELCSPWRSQVSIITLRVHVRWWFFGCPEEICLCRAGTYYCVYITISALVDSILRLLLDDDDCRLLSFCRRLLLSIDLSHPSSHSLTLWPTPEQSSRVADFPPVPLCCLVIMIIPTSVSSVY